ncbi:S-layer homology domain-containing protein [Marinicrinis lubricantis]|uniref:S-layer homology domain-containing protein n=1 Tax=Marinicrinis lubricantis TaxID=2086470 RepID=A0ABW1IN85_9BACL
MRRLSAMLASFIILAMVSQTMLYTPRAYADASPSPPPILDGWVQISTPQQLLYVDEHQEQYLSQNIQLMNSIDLSGYEWIPLGGNDYDSFSGTFDGRGYLISGITITDSNLKYAGFFGLASGTIQNLGVEVDIDSGFITGGLVGWLSEGSIDRSYSFGSVRSNYGSTTITETGGLVGGATHSTISRSYSTASVVGATANNITVGGLVGTIGTSTIRDSYARGSVSNEQHLSHVWSAGITTYTINGTIQNTYVTGHIDTPSTGINVIYSGLVSGFYMNSSVLSSFFDTETTGQTIGIQNSSSDNDTSGAAAKTTAEMQQQSTYELAGWDFTDTWTIHPDVNDGYPYLRPSILTTTLPDAVKDAPYSMSLAAFDGAASGITWNAIGLPNGLTLSSSGMLQGIPEESGTFNIHITATDAGSAEANATLLLTIREKAPDIAAFITSGSTKVTAVPNQPNHTFAYKINSSPPEQPFVGDSLPADAFAYLIGSDIPNVSSGSYLTVYEVDNLLHIQAWRSIQLEPAHIFEDISEPITVGTVTGTVYGEQHHPLFGVMISINGSQTTTDSEGRFTMHDVAEGAQTITISAAGYQTKEIRVNVMAGGTIDTGNIVLTLLPATSPVGTVTGTVYGSGNNPLPGVFVTADNIQSTTDSRGSFILNDITDGSHTMTFTAAGYQTKKIQVDVTAGGTVDVGRIVMTTVVMDEDIPNVILAPSSYSNMNVKMNGKDVRVKIVEETANDGRPVTRLILDASQVLALFDSNPIAVLEVDHTDPIIKVDLPSAAVQDVLRNDPNSALLFRVNEASITLPLHIWEGISNEAIITAAISKASESTSSEINAKLQEKEILMLADPIDFSFYIDDKPFSDFGDTYIERTMTLDSNVNPDTSTAVWVDENDELHFVPSVFQTGHGEATLVTMYAPHNSLYTVVSSNRSFTDIQGHWAHEEIEKLTNKLLLYGVSQEHFAPDRQVTRAEFAAMLVRSLGLIEKSGVSSFVDVQSEAWYAESVLTAHESGLIYGDEDGAFRPNEAITREQMISMMARAVKFAGSLPQTTNRSVLEPYTDAGDIAEWAKEPMIQLLEAELIQGVSETTFAPKKLASRAEAAAVLKRMLQYLQFINE